MKQAVLSIFALAATLSAYVAPPMPEVPEPSTVILMGAGLGALVYARHRMLQKKK